MYQPSQGPMVQRSIPNDIVSLNVGGHFYTTARSTLTRYPNSMLGAMFGGRGDFDPLRDNQGRYFIDRNGRLFEHVLNFLRTNRLVLPEDFKELPLLEMEADFYQIQPLIEELKSYKSRSHDVVIVNSENHSSYMDFIASSDEVSIMVQGLMYPRSEPEHLRGNVAALIKRIQDNGFSLHSHAACADKNNHAGSSMGVEDIEQDLRDALPEDIHERCVTAVLKWISDSGFSLTDGYAAYSGGGEREHSWVLVRENTQDPAESK